jgi:uncharacterized protein (TIGR03067 family)
MPSRRTAEPAIAPAVDCRVRGVAVCWARQTATRHPVPENHMTNRIASAFAGLVVLLGTASPSICADAKSKKTALEGTWLAVKKDSAVKRFKFTGNRFEATIGGKTCKGTFKLNDDENPMHLDLKITESTEEKYKGKTALGIYEFVGENIRWCSSRPGRKRRPGQFASQMGDARLLLATFKKQKKKS